MRPVHHSACRRCRGALRSAFALSLAGLATAAFADPIPPLTGTPYPEHSTQPDPTPLVLPRLGPSQFRADASAQGPWGFLDLKGPNLLGEMGGLRPALDKYGVQLTILENVETFGNLSGGVKQGFETDGLTTVTLEMDTEKAIGLKGGTLNVSGLQYWGGNLTANNLLVVQTLSDIEAPVAVRLWELWYQQKFGDKLDVKIGEQSLDEEFIISPTANSLFINGVSGFPALPAADLPSGGPAYPLAGLGVRGRAQLSDTLTVLVGVFNGSPIPRDLPNAPTSNPNGVSFPLDVGTLAIAELQYAYGSRVQGNANADGPLPGNYKLGAWYDSYKFEDLQTDTLGLPLASPLSNGTPAGRHGNFSLYGVADQMIWRSRDDANRTLNVFVRPMFTPYPDRNLVSASINAGLGLHAPLPGRDNNSFGVEMGTAWASGGASSFDRQMQVFQPSVYTPIRGSETFSRPPTSFRSCPRGRFSRMFSISSIPAWESQIRANLPSGSRTNWWLACART